MHSIYIQNAGKYGKLYGLVLAPKFITPTCVLLRMYHFWEDQPMGGTDGDICP